MEYNFLVLHFVSFLSLSIFKWTIVLVLFISAQKVTTLLNFSLVRL